VARSAGQLPDQEAVDRPRGEFAGLGPLAAREVSFRALGSMTARERDRAIGAAAIARQEQGGV